MKLKTKLLLVNSLPLIVFAAASLFLGLTQFRSALYDEKEGNLRSTAMAAMTLYASQGYGDYQRRQDGYVWRGMNFNISEKTSIVDDLKDETTVDITFFFGDRAAATSIRDENGKRLNGLMADEAIRTHTLKQGNPIWCRHIVIDGKDCQAYVIPIRQESDHSVVGALMASQSTAGFENMIHHYILSTVVVMMLVLAAVFLFVRWHVGWFSQKFSEIADRSRTDLLTGLFNKLTFENEAARYLSKKDPGTAALLLVFDVDDFKQVNDRFGHLMGDEVLKSFAKILIRCFRAGDILGRVGGDEFMVLMTDITPKDVKRADEVAQEVLECVHNLKIGKADSFSCSIGIGTAMGSCEFQELYKLADKALYEAKARGKDGFVRFSESDSATYPSK